MTRFEKFIAVGVLMVVALLLATVWDDLAQGQQPASQPIETRPLSRPGWDRLQDLAKEVAAFQKDFAALQASELAAAGLKAEDGWSLQWDLGANKPPTGWLMRVKPNAPAPSPPAAPAH
jgi:hypothetical protein